MSTPETAASKILGTVVCLPVRDLEASRDFYSRVFGLLDLDTEEGIVAVELPNLSLFLMEEEQFESYSRKVGRGIQYSSTNTGAILSCAIETREALDSIVASAPLHGGSVPVDPAVDDTTGLYLGYFFDPDGHHWELAFADQGA